MMTNLFSTFDPSTSHLWSMNWTSSLIPIILIPLKMWIYPTRSLSMTKLMLKKIFNEMKTLLSHTNSISTPLLMWSFLWFISMNNFMGLWPYTFTATSHMSISLAMSLPMWLTFMMFGWWNNTNKMFSHLLPQGTPLVLMSFMILIESISNLIRPLTLAIRLSANMIAGHLLLTLLGNQGSIYLMSSSLLVISTQILLLILELAVAVIQAYVFIVLMSLYSTEIH